MSTEVRRLKRGVSAKVEEKLRELAALIAQERYGEEGCPPLETTFAEIEELGHQAGQWLAGEIDQQLTAAHGQYFATSQACPQCGRLCDPSPRERELVTRDGAVALPESACRCPDCRRDFFPSARAASA